jgi:pimeloyl-ACP methyl ester carboxylesterase
MTQTVTALTEENTGKDVQAGRYRVHYHEAGHGPAVIMLHGAGPGASAWANFSGNFGPFAERHRTLLVDMLGYGGSESEVSDSEPATTVRARAVRDLMDALGIERASFVGNSMGGTVAMAFAVDYPERTEQLVLMGAGGLTRTVVAPQPTEGHRRLAEAAANPSMETMQALVNAMLFDPSLVSREFALIQARTLIVWGREDRVNPLEIGLQLLRDIPGSRLHVFRSCGHWAQIEHQEEFNRIALDFLAAP